MKQYNIILLAMLLAGCHEVQVKEPGLFSGGKWIDLTYPYSAETVYWPTVTTGFRLDTVSFGPTEGGYFYSAFAYSAPEHGGTHLDAPAHFAEGMMTTDEIPLDRLTGKAVIIDVTSKVARNKDYLVTVEDVAAWEKKYGAIPQGAIVIFKTGFGSYYPDAQKYLGTADKGPEAVKHLHFPGIAPALAAWLVNRKVKAVGIDTASIDYGQSTDFKTHRSLFAANIPGFENVANLDALPDTGAYVVALPMKIKGGSGGPLRIVAWVNE